MKNKLLIVLSIFILVSCNKDDSNTDPDNQLNIVVTSYEPKKAFYGGILTITGENFDRNADNTITINGQEQEIKLVLDNKIEVKIVEGTSSGEIQLSNSGGSSKIGDILVANEIVYTELNTVDYNFGVFKINSGTGKKEDFIFDNFCNVPSYNSYGISYNKQDKEFTGYSDLDVNGQYYYYYHKYSIENSSCESVNVNKGFRSLKHTDDGRVFGVFIDNLVEIDSETGFFIRFVLQDIRIRNIQYDSDNNQFLMYVNETNTSELHTYDLSTEAHTVVDLNSRFIQALKLLPNGRLLATGPRGPYNCRALYELNKETGEASDPFFTMPSEYCPANQNHDMYGMAYLPSINSLLINVKTSNDERKHMVYDLDTNEYEMTNLPSGQVNSTLFVLEDL
tara:strand:+ start:45007 stop:46188 length:1182 start_codon:yes stop_codon:yes gene_type:complete